MYPSFTFFGVEFSSYGLCGTIALTVGVLWCWSWRESLKVPGETEADFWILAYMLFLGWLIGARLAFYAVEWDFVKEHPWALLRYWRTGWVFWGGLAGAIAAGALNMKVYAMRHPNPRAFLPLTDYGATALPLGHWIGRIGCFLNGCCYGRPTTMPWGVRFTHPATQVEPALRGLPLHPTQLYEAAGEIAIFLFLWRLVLPRVRSAKYRYGTAFFTFVILYSILRFVVECFRGDDRGSFLSPALSPSQWGSVAALMIASVTLYVRGIAEPHPKTRSMFQSR